MKILPLRLLTGNGKCQRDMDLDVCLIEVCFNFTLTLRSTDIEDEIKEIKLKLIS